MIKKKEEINRTGIEIAVIGMAGRFPGAKNISEFWENLKNRVESLSFLSEKEINELEGANKLKSNPNYVNSKGGVLESVEYFDASFFGYTPLEAEIMEPQIRIFLESAWEALEDAGYAPGYYPGLIGLYAGASNHFNWMALSRLSGKSAELGGFAANLLADRDFLSASVSYKLGLKGPTVSVQTACSTSLVAIHLACQAILNGECDIALAGGVSVGLTNKVGYMYKEGMILSPDGRCRAFDAKAKGCVAGSGAGVVVLKLLNDAIEDRDHFYAVVKGSAINNDGNRKSGFTAPSVEGQIEVIMAALQVSEVSSERITYVETHGTGTILGDPIEIEALKKGFNTNKRNFCAIGSVKPNVGHLDAAAGVTSFIKTVLALKHRLLPPSLNFDTPNPEIDFKNSPFFVNTVLREWKSNGYPLRAGVSSFGIGGTNAHVVLEEAPASEDSSGGRASQLLILSAKSKSALDIMSINLAGYLKNNPGINLADVSFTLHVGRTPFNYRRMVVCSDLNEAIDTLSTKISETVNPTILNSENIPIVFMFSGIGSQYVNMGLDLYTTEALFQSEMDRCFRIVESLSGINIKDILYPSIGNAELSKEQSLIANPKLYPDMFNRFEVAQVVVFILEYALSRLLMEWGIKPSALIGYSFGEFSAACLAGVFSLEDALKVIVSRGKLIHTVPGGAMLSVPLPFKEVKSLIFEGLSIAIDNGLSCVVSGSYESIATFEEKMKDMGQICMRIKTSQAIHSEMMEPILEKFEAKVKEVKLNKLQIPYISNVTGTWMSDNDAKNPAYWKRHLRETVRFSDGIKELMKNENVIFVEIGPGRDISALLSRYVENNPGVHVVNIVRPSTQKVSDMSYLLNKIGVLWLWGLKIDWAKFYSKEKRYRISLPFYPFESHRYWIDGDILKMGTEKMKEKSQSHISADMSDWLYLPSWKRFTLYPVLQKIKKKSVKYNWVVFLNDLNPGKLIVDRLKNEGHTVIVVKTGNIFERKDEWTYTINPKESNSYDDFFIELQKLNVIPDKIIQCWGLTGDNDSCSITKSFEEVQYLGFFSLFYIVKAIEKQILSSYIEITVLTDQLHEVVGGELLCPAKSTILGLIHSIPNEFPGIRLVNIDILLPQPGTPEEDALINIVLEELTFGYHELVVAIRNNNRWIRIFEPLHLGPELKDYAKLRKDGVYLITGGLGKVGLILSEMLARRVGARLVLTGRSQFPPNDELKIKKIRQIEAMGGQVLYIQADVSDLEQMREAILCAERTFGAINGVIHCAGIVDGRSMGMINFLTVDDCRIQFQSKVYGTMVLDELLRDKELDFAWMLSSLASFLSGLGFAPYAAVNIFMDTFAKYRNRLKNKRHNWLSLNWNAMETAESIEIFERLLSLENIDQVIFSIGGNFQERFDRSIKHEEFEKQVLISCEEENRSIGHPRPYLSSKYERPQNFREKGIAAIWERILGIDGIGVNDDFLELGGDSLKAITILAAIHKKMNVKIPLPEIFNAPTIRELSEFITKKAVEDKYAAIEFAEEKEFYLLSSAQMRLFILQQMNLDSTAYNMPEIIPLPAEFDCKKIEETFKKLIKRHDSLRTSFHIIDNTPVQVIHGEVEFKLDFHDLQDSNHSQNFIKRFIKAFDLSKPPLIRAALIKKEDKSHILVVDMHHIISDGVSHEILVNDFMSLYAGKDLLPLRIQYKDFSQWQNGEKENLKRQEEYWVKEFEGEIPVLELPSDYPRPLEQSFEGSIEMFEISPKETGALNVIALSKGSTLFMVLMAIYNILISKLSGQEDIVIGIPIAGRRHVDLEKIIGMFVNTLPLRNYPVGDRSFSDFLDDVKERTLMSFENQEYPFEELVDRLNVKRDIGHNPLFDMMLVMQNMYNAFAGQDKKTEIQNSQSFQSDSSNEYKTILQVTKFDLTLFASEIDRGLFLSFEYRTKLFKKETILRFIDYIKRIIDSIIDGPEKKISEIEIMSEAEKKRLLYDFNNVVSDYPKDKTIYQIFEEQVERTPDNIAIIGPSVLAKYEWTHRITYKELNEKSNRLANVLQLKGVGLDRIVGIMMERSIEMMIGILGILKSGGAYLTIDIEYPKDRIDYMLNESGAKFIVSNNDLEELPNLLTSQLPNFYHLSATSLAYVIYTSGSTGKPKGAMVEHIGMTNHIYAKVNDLHLSKNSIVAQNASHTFDISVWQFFASLTQGGKTIIYSNEVVLIPERFVSRLISDQISILEVVPSYLSVLLRSIVEKNITFLPLEYLLVTGEEVKQGLIKQWFEIFPGIKMVNAYGPTEASDDITHHIMERVPDLESIPIGKPVQNMRIYIVDNNMQLCPIGVKGEIWVSGIGVGRGYLNDMQKTSLAFIIDPFVKEKGVRVYRTGDLGRWFPDGTIEFFGRMDNQVKIHGFRVELGEIENRILKYPGIKEGVVIDRTEENGDKYLCAYIVSEKEYEISELREMLSEELPDYMIPSYFIRMEKIPLTPNGKVDRRALPRPELKVGVSYKAPGNEIEKKFVELWAEVLGRDELHASQLKTSIGIDDNFFELGGHSLRATILVSKIHKEFDVKVPLAELFKLPTISGLAVLISKLAKDKYAAIEPVEEKEFYPLSSVQKRLYVVQQMQDKSKSYNMPTVVALDGLVDCERLNNTFKLLIKRHESLRTSFLMIEGEVMQVIHKDFDFTIEYYETAEENAQKIIATFLRAFDLSTAPLVRVGVIRIREDQHVLMVDMHHIISDGVSYEILVKEFSALYMGETLSPLRIHYKDFSEWQNRLNELGAMNSQKEYWLSKFKNGNVPTLNMPLDFPRPTVRNNDAGESVNFSIDTILWRKIYLLLEKTGTTLSMILLAAYNILLHNFTRQEDIIIGIIINGRTHADLENLIGMFINAIPLRSYPQRDKTFAELLEEVKKSSLSAFENQDYPLDELVVDLGLQGKTDRNSLFDVAFNLDNIEKRQVKNIDLKVKSFQNKNEFAKFDLVLYANEMNQTIYLSFRYSTQLFKQSTIEKIKQYYIEIIEKSVDNVDIKLKDIVFSHRFINPGKKIDENDGDDFKF